MSNSKIVSNYAGSLFAVAIAKEQKILDQLLFFSNLLGFFINGR
mgnify:CR=1 FL=1